MIDFGKILFNYGVEKTQSRETAENYGDLAVYKNRYVQSRV